MQSVSSSQLYYLRPIFTPHSHVFAIITAGAWWKVDLGQSVDVASIKLFPRQDDGKQHTVASSVISLNDEYANILGVYNIGPSDADGTVSIFQSINNILQLEILASDFEVSMMLYMPYSLCIALCCKQSFLNHNCHTLIALFVFDWCLL